MRKERIELDWRRQAGEARLDMLVMICHSLLAAFGSDSVQNPRERVMLRDFVTCDAHLRATGTSQ